MHFPLLIPVILSLTLVSAQDWQCFGYSRIDNAPVGSYAFQCQEEFKWTMRESMCSQGGRYAPYGFQENWQWGCDGFTYNGIVFHKNSWYDWQQCWDAFEDILRRCKYEKPGFTPPGGQRYAGVGGARTYGASAAELRVCKSNEVCNTLKGTHWKRDGEDHAFTVEKQATWNGTHTIVTSDVEVALDGTRTELLEGDAFEVLQAVTVPKLDIPADASAE